MMKRLNKNRKPDAILCADIHLRESKPACRTDDFWETLWIKLGFVKRLQEEYGCMVIHAGDLYHQWRPSPYLLSKTIQHLPSFFCTVYGQHDLPNHNVEQAFRCGVDTLENAGALQIFDSCHFGETPKEPSLILNNGRRVLVWHYMTYKDERPFPQHVGPTAKKLLRKYDEYDLIVTGDNHKPFVEQLEGRVLVNPGSLYRSTAAQIDHRPRVYLYYTEDNTVKPIYIPIEKDVITREHIEIAEQRNQRIDAFISSFDMYWKAEDSLEQNLVVFFTKNKVRQPIQDVIYKAIDNE